MPTASQPSSGLTGQGPTAMDDLTGDRAEKGGPSSAGTNERLKAPAGCDDAAAEGGEERERVGGGGGGDGTETSAGAEGGEAGGEDEHGHGGGSGSAPALPPWRGGEGEAGSVSAAAATDSSDPAAAAPSGISGDGPSSDGNGAAKKKNPPKRRRMTSFEPLPDPHRAMIGTTDDDDRSSSRCGWAKLPKRPRKGECPEDLRAAHAELRQAEKERSEAVGLVEAARTEFDRARRILEEAERRAEVAETKAAMARSTVQEIDLRRGGVRWNDMFRKLEAFHSEHGHCRVSSVPTFKSDPALKKLDNWIRQNRATYRDYQNGKRTTTKPYRMEALERLGVFVGKWDLKYQELKKFKEEHGHCNVPTKAHRDNPKLGNWIGLQRNQYKRLMEGKDSTLTQERVDRLNEIGFCWNMFEARREEEECDL